MSQAILCTHCRQKMFAGAKVCPHCGGARTGPDEPLKLSSEEARALLKATVPDSAREGDPTYGWAKWILGPVRPGWAELVLSALALPLTLFSLFSVGLAEATAARWKRGVRTGPGHRELAVIASTGLMALMLWENDAPSWTAVVSVGSFAAWGVREVLRRSRRQEAH